MFRSFLIVAGFLVLTQPAAANTLDAIQADLVRRLVERHVIPRYEVFAGRTAHLEETLERHCAAPSETSAGQTADALEEAWVSWAGIRHVAIGPVTYLDRLYRIQFWPDSRNRTGKGVAGLVDEAAGGRPVDKEVIAGASVAVQGFPALERLIFGEAGEFLLDGSRPTDCAVAVAISAYLAGMAADIHAQWTSPPVDFGRELIAPKPVGGPFASQSEALASLLTNAAAGLEALAHQRLERPMGTSLERVRPRRAEAWRSGLSTGLARADFASLIGFMSPEGGDVDGALRALGQVELADLLLRAMGETAKTLETLVLQIEAAGGDPIGREELERLLLQLTALRGLLTEKVAPSLGVAAGFNALDGD